MLASKPSRAKFPLATIAAYGPDNKRATKLVVGILRRAGQKDPNPMRTWSTAAGDVRNDPVIAAEVADWLRSQRITETLNCDRIIGCPHEEGIDYPIWAVYAPVSLLGWHRPLHARADPAARGQDVAP